MMFYIIKDGLFFAGYFFLGKQAKVRWDSNIAYIFRTKEGVEESQQEVGGEIKTFTAT